MSKSNTPTIKQSQKLTKVGGRTGRKRKPEILHNPWRDEMERRAKRVRKKITVNGQTVTVSVKVYPASDEEVGESPLNGYGNPKNWRAST